MSRALYLAAYDVRNPLRLQEAVTVLKNYASGGQKSVFECFLSRWERRRLLDEVAEVLDLEVDSFVLVPLRRQTRPRPLGVAVEPVDPGFFYVG